jgi:hypothetical protein
MRRLSNDIVEIIWQDRYKNRKGNEIKEFLYLLLTIFLFHITVIPIELINHPTNSYRNLIPYALALVIYFITGVILTGYLVKSHNSRNVSQIYIRVWIKSANSGLCIFYIGLLLLRSFIVICQYENIFPQNQDKYLLIASLIWLILPLFLNFFSYKTIPYLFSKKLRNNPKVMRFFLYATSTALGIGLFLTKILAKYHDDIRPIIVVIGLYFISILINYLAILIFYMHINLLIFGIPKKIISINEESILSEY